MEPQRPQKANAILKKKNKARGIVIPDFKLYYKAIVIKTVCTGTKTMEQWNIIENPEMDPQLYGQFIFDKAGKNIQWKKRQSFQQMLLEKQDSDMQKNETGPLSLLTSHTKTNSKWMKNLNVREETIKLLDENTGSNSLTLAVATSY